MSAKGRDGETGDGGAITVPFGSAGGDARRAALGRGAATPSHPISHKGRGEPPAVNLYLISGGELGCNPLDSRFRGNDGVKIGNNSAIIASLRPLRLRAFASNFVR